MLVQFYLCVLHVARVGRLSTVRAEPQEGARIPSEAVVFHHRMIVASSGMLTVMRQLADLIDVVLGMINNSAKNPVVEDGGRNHAPALPAFLMTDACLLLAKIAISQTNLAPFPEQELSNLERM